MAATTTVTETVPQETAPDAQVVIDLEHQYVSGGQGLWYGASARSLPWPIDDVTFAFGDDLYARMMADAIVGSAVNIFKAGVLSEGVALSSAITDKTKDGYDQAAELVGWCEDILDDLDPALDVVLWNMLDAISYGNKVAELIYETDTTYTGALQVVLRSLHVKPRHAVAMVVDPYKKLLGVLGLFPGENVWPLTGIQIPDVGAQENFVPAEKFAVLTSRMEDNDPRGTSILRGAYDPWWRKQQTKSEHLAYLARFASPSLIGFTGKGMLPGPKRNPDGTNVLVNGQTVTQYPSDVMRDALAAFRNASVAVFSDPEGGTRVQPIEASGNGEAFLHAFEVEDREIIKAVLTATLASGEGEHASRAQASIHQDAQQTLFGQIKGVVAAMLRRQVLRRLVTYNYGATLARLTPRVSLGKVAREDLAKLWTAVAALETSGYLDPSQRQPLDVDVSLPERDVEAATAGATGAQTEVDGGTDPAKTPGTGAPPATEDMPPAEQTAPPPGAPAPWPAPGAPPAPKQHQRRAA